MGSMFLKRKQAFRGDRLEVTARSNLVGYLNRGPEADYVKLEAGFGYNSPAHSTAWVGEHRRHNSRQLAVVQVVAKAGLTDFRFLAGIAHPNIARLIALYHKDDIVHVVYEYVELNLFDICPLSEVEVVEVMSQVSVTNHVSIEVLRRAIDHFGRAQAHGAIHWLLHWLYPSYFFWGGENR